MRCIATTVGALAVAVVLAARPLVGAAVVIIGGYLLIRLRRARQSRRHAVIRADVLAALEVLIAELSVGAHPVHAFRQAGIEARHAGADEQTLAVLTRMVGNAELGGDVRAGLVVKGATRRTALSLNTIGAANNVGAANEFGAASSPGAEWLAVADACAIAERHGLPLAELLTATRTDIAARGRFAERARASLAGARATSVVLALLPLLGIGLGQAIGAAPLSTLFGAGVGPVLLLIGVTLTVMGVEWAERISRRAVAG
ncbi:hypothetical protein GCM10027169_29330 [Gordonia jinhuaensis]|uniref:type II secretion system F family protein n=1 Tax=Gordonia jinhuaensis TaxID=1517702 RepID=UPI0016668897|nr:hypothetical protein [Gordonia jinhuaensis]